MSSEHQPYFFTPAASSQSYPLFVFLPGLDETAKELMSCQTAGLETGFDVRCFVIPPDELKTFDYLAQKVIALTRAELEKAPRSLVYLCGESFGGCIALQVLLTAPDLFNRIVLVNPASSFHRVAWLSLGSLLFPLTPKPLYKISGFIALPFLANLTRVPPMALLYLFKSVAAAPQGTANHRIGLMRQFELDLQRLRQITQPVLLIGSEQDQILPSAEEVQRLATYFPNAHVVLLPHSGHACLVEADVNLYEIMQLHNFLS